MLTWLGKEVEVIDITQVFVVDWISQEELVGVTGIY